MGTTDPSGPIEAAIEHLAAIDGENPDTYDDHHGPVPVAVTDTVTVKEFPPFRIHTEQVPVPVSPGQPIRVLGNVPTRVSATMVARGGDVYIGDPNLTIGTGFLIPDGGGFTTQARGDLYAIAPATGAALHVLTEHREG